MIRAAPLLRAPYDDGESLSSRSAALDEKNEKKREAVRNGTRKQRGRRGTKRDIDVSARASTHRRADRASPATAKAAVHVHLETRNLEGVNPF